METVSISKNFESIPQLYDAVLEAFNKSGSCHPEDKLAQECFLYLDCDGASLLETNACHFNAQGNFFFENSLGGRVNSDVLDKELVYYGSVETLRKRDS